MLPPPLPGRTSKGGEKVGAVAKAQMQTRCRSGVWKRVAGRARAEGQLDRVLRSGDLVQGKYSKARIGLFGFREAAK